MKCCLTCLVPRPLSEFGKVQTYYRGECNPCRRLREKTRRNSELEQARARDRARYHENEKRRTEMKRRAAEWNKKHGAWQKRRARIAGAPEIESIDRQVIYNRDEGRCHICGDDVSRSLFDLDHIIPISRGGSHTAENIKISHPSCNRSKGARLLGV